MIHGLDTRSRAWHVVREDGGYDSRVLGDRVAADDARIELAGSWREYVDSSVVSGDAIVCEEPLSLQNGKTSRILGMAASAIHLATFWPHPERRRQMDVGLGDWSGIRWVWADVAMWKRLIVGSGAADKDDIAAWALLTYGVSYEDQDHADATGIRDYGKVLEGMGWDKPLSEKDLKKLHKKSPEKAEAHKALVAAGVDHLRAWREAR